MNYPPSAYYDIIHLTAGTLVNVALDIVDLIRRIIPPSPIMNGERLVSVVPIIDD